MSSPKAGMFNVVARRWKKSPKKAKSATTTTTTTTTGWDSSDSDYVESDEEPAAEITSPAKGGAEVGI